MVMKGKALQTAQLLLVVLPAFVLFGYNQSGIGGLLSLEDWNAKFPLIDVKHATGSEKDTKSTIQGTVVATFTLGALLGALSCSKLGDILGRRKTIFIGAIFTLIGEILECTSFHIAQFIVGRTILGYGIGMLSATVPVWQSEVRLHLCPHQKVAMLTDRSARQLRRADLTLYSTVASSRWDTCWKLGLILRSLKLTFPPCNGVFRLPFRPLSLWSSWARSG